MSAAFIAFSMALDGEFKQSTGYVCPDTDGTLVAHERWTGHWRVTHIPSGRIVISPHKEKFAVREQAFGFARRFYAEITKLGFDMKSTDGKAIYNLFNGIPYGERAEFWERVL